MGPGDNVRLTSDEARGMRSNEMWEERQRRHRAALVLGNWEMLTWYALAGGEVRPILGSFRGGLGAYIHRRVSHKHD